VSEIICKGTMIFQTNCGKCSKCYEESLSQLAALREEAEQFREWRNEKNLEILASVEDANNQFAENEKLKQRLADAERRNAELEGMLDTPHTSDWFEGVKLEAGHQIKRWGSEHDAGKGPADWFWLIGYLAQKAMTSQMLGNEVKAKHHTISTGAALLNWFRAITGDSTAMRPGIDDAALNKPEEVKELNQ
jgi:hypothetical protein